MEQSDPSKPNAKTPWRRLKHILTGVVTGFAILVGACWILIHTLGDREPLYQGKPIIYWAERIRSSDPEVTNQASLLVRSTIIPQLLQGMFHDTHDSQIRAWLVDFFNDNLPGVQVYYLSSASRRVRAVQDLGRLGPLAHSALPDLIRALHGTDAAVRPAAALSLGMLQSEPQAVIPLLITTLDDPQEGVPEAAVKGLGAFGGQAKAAVPKLLELAKTPDKDMRNALHRAFRRIDPDAAAKAGFR